MNVVATIGVGCKVAWQCSSNCVTIDRLYKVFKMQSDLRTL